MLQDALIRFFRTASSLRSLALPYVISRVRLAVRCILVDAQRARARAARNGLPALPDRQPDDPQSTEPCIWDVAEIVDECALEPAVAVSAAEDVALARWSLMALPSQMKAAVELVVEMGLSIRSAARTLGITHTAVRKKIDEARWRISARLNGSRGRTTNSKKWFPLGRGRRL